MTQFQEPLLCIRFCVCGGGGGDGGGGRVRGKERWFNLMSSHTKVIPKTLKMELAALSLGAQH